MIVEHDVRAETKKHVRKGRTAKPATIARWEASNAIRFEQMLIKRPHMRILRDAATSMGLEVSGLRNRASNTLTSRLRIDGVEYEVHNVRTVRERLNRFTGIRDVFARTTVHKTDTTADRIHVVLIDLPELDTLKAYRFTPEDISELFFAKARRARNADVFIPAHHDGKFTDYRLDWPLKRPPPSEA